jgi:hypothetical protein
MKKKAENSNTPLQPSLDIAGVRCCINCKHSLLEIRQLTIGQTQYKCRARQYETTIQLPDHYFCDKYDSKYST